MLLVIVKSDYLLGGYIPTLRDGFEKGFYKGAKGIL